MAATIGEWPRPPRSGDGRDVALCCSPLPEALVGSGWSWRCPTRPPVSTPRCAPCAPSGRCGAVPLLRRCFFGRRPAAPCAAAVSRHGGGDGGRHRRPVAGEFAARAVDRRRRLGRPRTRTRTRARAREHAHAATHTLTRPRACAPHRALSHTRGHQDALLLGLIHTTVTETISDADVPVRQTRVRYRTRGARARSPPARAARRLLILCRPPPCPHCPMQASMGSRCCRTCAAFTHRMARWTARPWSA